MSPRPAPERRDAYPHFDRLTTRWMDNDVYRHVNNVVYYSYFDTVVNGHLMASGFLDIERGPVIGLVVETQCRYFRPIAFPSIVTGGLRLGHVGNTSVRYEIGLFEDEAKTAAAQGHFVHVYVDRDSGRPVPLPDALWRALEPLRTPATTGAATAVP